MKKRVKRKPLVSVVMPVYNASAYLKEAISSVLSQSFADFELICVDDGSTDGSWMILRSLARTDSRIRVYKNKHNMGIGYTRKRLVGLAKASYLAVMDADDVMLPDRLERQVDYMSKHPKVVVLGGQCVTINEAGEVTGAKTFPLSHKGIYKMMFTRMSIQQPASMINLKLVPKNFSWYDNSVSPVEDLDNLFRLFNYGKFANLRVPVLKYRVYYGSSSLKNPKRTFWLTQKVREQAVSKYGYQASMQAWLVVILQAIVVTLLPARLIYPVYELAFGKKRLFDGGSLSLTSGKVRYSLARVWSGR